MTGLDPHIFPDNSAIHRENLPLEAGFDVKGLTECNPPNL
ncbi:MAG: hypothetical protein HLUCCO16_16560 [Phormidium sp. OSCR]|nr:MAG: hypothetical protein HLUCCO16_16560 [Phormidium sp. OSCR]